MLSRVSRLYLVDVSSYIFRAFHAIPPLNNKNGLPTNAILGVVNMLLKLVNEERPEAIAIVFDAGGPTFRDEIADDYKANRTPTPDALRPQLPYVRKVIEAFRLRCVGDPGVEADDVIATLARSFASPSNDVVIVTGDKDLMQLVGPHVSLYMPSGGRGGTLEPRRIGRADVEQRFGVPPEKVVEVMALTGDSIDNIPGREGNRRQDGAGAHPGVRLASTSCSLASARWRSSACEAPSAFASCSKAKRSRRARRASWPV